MRGEIDLSGRELDESDARLRRLVESNIVGIAVTRLDRVVEHGRIAFSEMLRGWRAARGEWPEAAPSCERS